MSEFDPATQLLADLQQAPLDPMLDPFASPTAESNHDEFPTPESLGQQAPPPEALLASVARRRAVDLLKQNIKFSPHSLATLENYVNAPSLEECFAIMLGAVCELQDFMAGSELTKAAADTFVVSDALKAQFTAYSKAYVLSSAASCFRGKEGVEACMAAMRESKVADLADGAHTLIKSSLGNAVTSFRSTVKSKLSESIRLSVGDENRNISVIAYGLVNRTGIPVTLQLLQRLTFIRWHLINYPNIDDKQFWSNVDNTAYMAFAKDPEAGETGYLKLLQTIYESDKVAYGGPTGLPVKYKPVDLLASDVTIAKWISCLNKHLAKLRPEPLKESGRAAKKRKVSERQDTE